MTDFPIFLINLDRSPERLAAATEALETQGAGFIRIPAFDGRELDVEGYQDYDSLTMRAYMGRDMTGGEIGCYVSHVRALEAFVDSGAPHCLVLEDDMQPRPDAIARLRVFMDWVMQQKGSHWYVAHIAQHRLKITTRIAEIATGGGMMQISHAHYFPMMANALVWRRAGAEAFLKIAYPITAPVDNRLREWLLGNDHGLAVRPWMFTTSGAASEIDKSNPNKRRSSEGRAPFYSLHRQRRLMGEKLFAYLHKARRYIGSRK